MSEFHKKPNRQSNFAQAMKKQGEKAKKNKPKTKKQGGNKLHPRNKHQGKYNLEKLTKVCPGLSKHIVLNVRNEQTIDFSNPEAVKLLNSALLKQYYNLSYWDIPEGYLCPPIPGRADYIHYMADVLAESNDGKIPEGAQITCLDVGTGANCIYPIIGANTYGWSFVGSDIDKQSIASARKIVEKNLCLNEKVELKLQPNTKNILQGILSHEKPVDLTICNPPFHASLQAAQEGTLRKLSNLNKKKASKVVLNFGGKGNELWCEGGELKFISNMIRESKAFAKSCLWFSSLVSKSSHLKFINEELDKAGIANVKTIPMGQGNKASRVVAWTFLSQEEQKEWIQTKWNTDG